MARSPRRTDPHRPGAIVPADYEYIFSYNGATSQDGWPVPSFGINCELDRRREWKDDEGKTHIENGKHNKNGLCCVVGMLAHGHKFAMQETHGTCQCSICGTHFVYGDVWRHIPTGEFIHVGHQCAEKYNMLADRSEWHKEHGRLRQAAAVECQKEQRKEAREAFLNEHEGLREALEEDHYIIADLGNRLAREGYLSDKQVALALKIAAEVRNPTPKVDAPTGRVDFVGEVVGIKEVLDGPYGPQTKITVKVQELQGIWIAQGTCPRALVSKVERGMQVALRATLKPSRNHYFAYMSRPSGSFVQPKEEKAAS